MSKKETHFTQKLLEVMLYPINFLFFMSKRTALPFGGFEKASRLVTFEPQEVKVTDEEPQQVSVLQYNLCCRPSFNRTPIGWTCNEEHSYIHMELENIPFDGETDDL